MLGKGTDSSAVENCPHSNDTQTRKAPRAGKFKTDLADVLRGQGHCRTAVRIGSAAIFVCFYVLCGVSLRGHVSRGQPALLE